MTSDQSKSTNSHGLIVSPSTGLMKLPDGGSSALSEIISRSLLHIQTSRELVVPARKAGEECEFEIAPGVKIVMCWIPLGEFLMGSPEDELGPWPSETQNPETQHRVMLTQGFWLGKYPVTQAQWEAVMRNNLIAFKGSNLAVESVSWTDISESGGFLEKVNGFAAAGEIFSLPTEAQWEYASRAGTVTALNSGKILTKEKGACPNLNELAWYRENSEKKIHPVGQKKANGWGLHDMHGNVWEFCSDWYGDYSNEPQVDPRGPDSGKGRVVRGGSCRSSKSGCRVAFRTFSNPAFDCYSSNVGFRIARCPFPR